MVTDAASNNNPVGIANYNRELMVKVLAKVVERLQIESTTVKGSFNETKN